MAYYTTGQTPTNTTRQSRTTTSNRRQWPAASFTHGQYPTATHDTAYYSSPRSRSVRTDWGHLCTGNIDDADQLHPHLDGAFERPRGGWRKYGFEEEQVELPELMHFQPKSAINRLAGDVYIGYLAREYLQSDHENWHKRRITALRLLSSKAGNSDYTSLRTLSTAQIDQVFSEELYLLRNLILNPLVVFDGAGNIRAYQLHPFHHRRFLLALQARVKDAADSLINSHSVTLPQWDSENDISLWVTKHDYEVNVLGLIAQTEDLLTMLDECHDWETGAPRRTEPDRRTTRGDEMTGRGPFTSQPLTPQTAYETYYTSQRSGIASTSGYDSPGRQHHNTVQPNEYQDNSDSDSDTDPGWMCRTYSSITTYIRKFLTNFV
ncbi:hypothetical protein BDZ89DRAFT_1140111 [Hymenopellis radicata]|nr:hypothetical protein BDZ89DRAFT_1140111 [Hymenopellis radicata]